MQSDTYSQTWDLDVFFKGGSSSEEFHKHVKNLRNELDLLESRIKELDPESNHCGSQLKEVLDRLQSAKLLISQAVSFVSCLQAQNMADEKARDLHGSLLTLTSRFESAQTALDIAMAAIPDHTWDGLLGEEGFRTFAFILNERRTQARQKLPLEQEMLISALSVDGYYSWSSLYSTIVGMMKIPSEDGSLSVGQAANKLNAGDRNIRKQLFCEWEKAWDEKASLFAETLNHIAGFRLEVYKHRGWEDVLKEPLACNRMKKETLDTMWRVITSNKQPFARFLKRKAELLGLSKLSWFDLDAPAAAAHKHYSFQEGAEFIQRHFAEFGPKLASFTKTVFENRWIEAENRPGKRPGGFCTTFGASKQSRIFMTYTGTPSNVSTLAHELGHAFHAFVLKDTPPLNRGYAMNVAETASTFAEMIVADASVQSAPSKEEKIKLLEAKIQRTIGLLMNIHARFLFETRFYEERRKGPVSRARLDDLMLEAQKEAYAESLDQYHPMFWASKMHFYITGTPFYNFPYTFGFLFSLGIYAQAGREGARFEEKYIALLQDTGVMNVEDLALKHLGADLTKPEFWEAGIRLCIQDIQEYIDLTSE